jgi:hypothetical protein
MEKLRRTLRWGTLLWKRLYKKWVFLLLLVLIPVLVFGYGQTTQEDSGLMTVALASRAERIEPLTRSIWDELLRSNVVRYIECADPEEARALVESDGADVAWIFEADLESKIYDFVAHRSRSYAFITILEPENHVTLKLARELVSGILFSYCAEPVYLQYIRENAPELDHLTDRQLLQYYEDAIGEENLFVFSDMEGNLQQEDAQDNYLLTPVRGMLGVVAVLAGLATAMYYIRDEKNGTFAWIPLGRRGGVEFGCQLISLLNVVAVALISLALAGQAAALGREVLIAILYSFCVAGFAMLVRRLTVGIRGLGMATPLLLVVMLTVCPVFFDLGVVRQLQYCFPPTYFVNAAYQDRYLLAMGLYGAVCLAVCGILDLCRLKFTRQGA